MPELRLALTHEFLDRGDGWPALKRRYDLQQRNVVGVDHDVAYRQLLAGEVDIIDVYSTDAMIRRGDLVLLKDDASFFPRYDAVWLYRLDAASRYPELIGRDASGGGNGVRGHDAVAQRRGRSGPQDGIAGGGRLSQRSKSGCTSKCKRRRELR